MPEAMHMDTTPYRQSCKESIAQHSVLSMAFTHMSKEWLQSSNG